MEDPEGDGAPTSADGYPFPSAAAPAAPRPVPAPRRAGRGGEPALLLAGASWEFPGRRMPWAKEGRPTGPSAAVSQAPAARRRIVVLLPPSASLAGW